MVEGRKDAVKNSVVVAEEGKGDTKWLHMA